MQEKRATDPDGVREYNKTWRDKNRERVRARARGYYDPEKRRKALLKKNYGMTVEEHEALWKAQGEACAVCRCTEPNGKKNWATDHCHQGGQVRGILCNFCNSMLGYARDNIDVLSAAIGYLERSKK